MEASGCYRETIEHATLFPADTWRHASGFRKMKEIERESRESAHEKTCDKLRHYSIKLTILCIKKSV